MHYSPLIAAVALFGASFAQADEQPDPDNLEARNFVIGEIELDKSNIFDLSNPKENNWLYRMANRLHIVTRDDVIRDQLLFKPGEPFEARLLDEDVPAVLAMDPAADPGQGRHRRHVDGRQVQWWRSRQRSS